MPPRQFTLTDGRALVIKEAETGDAAAVVAALNRIGGQTDFLTFGENGFAVSVEAQESVIAIFQERPNALMLLAEVEGNLAGVLTFEGGPRPRLAHTGEFGISLLQAYWGLGIGTRLLEGMIEWAKASGVVRKINLRVHEHNQQALSLYQKLGFQPEGIITREYLIDGQFYANILMGLTID
jgi:RimJ/RimL family protein N-acetyltransferase